ncbi:hypothetical protein ABZ070_00855 [Streptomyces sp. NPDC006283]|uniref:hypothetical protein n=1 Tax=Streptomyces sp. NPDC006283 TaxID=3156741 RepID=UPI0033A6C999
MTRQLPRLFLALLLAMTSLFLPARSGAADRNTGASPLDRTWFGPPTDLGVQQYTSAVIDAVVGTEDGRPTAYTTVSGENAVFNVIDIRDNRRLRSFTLTGVEQSWRHAIGREHSAPQQHWFGVQALGTAPTGTAHVRLSLYSSAENRMTAYVDTVSVKATRRP